MVYFEKVRYIKKKMFPVSELWTQKSSSKFSAKPGMWHLLNKNAGILSSFIIEKWNKMPWIAERWK